MLTTPHLEQRKSSRVVLEFRCDTRSRTRSRTRSSTTSSARSKNKVKYKQRRHQVQRQVQRHTQVLPTSASLTSTRPIVDAFFQIGKIKSIQFGLFARRLFVAFAVLFKTIGGQSQPLHDHYQTIVAQGRQRQV